MFAAFFVLSIIAGLVIFGIMLGKRKQTRQVNQDQAEAAKPADPFEDMTYEDTGAALKGAGAPGLFKDFESEAEMWQKARDTFERADALIAESAQMRADGNADWRDKSAEAKELCEEALQRADVWRDVLVKEVGESSTEVKRLDKTLQKWRRTSMILHKTVSR